MQTTRGQIEKLLSAYPDMTYQEIGEIVGCSRQWVHQVHQDMKETGLIGDKRSRLYRDDVTVDRVLAFYYHSNLLVNDIAQLFGCHEETIRPRLRLAGISQSESYSRKQKLYWRRLREAIGVAG